MIVTLLPAMSPVTMSPLSVAVVAVRATEAISSPRRWPHAERGGAGVERDGLKRRAANAAVAEIAPPAVLTARFEPSASSSVAVPKVTASAVLVNVVGARR